MFGLAKRKGAAALATPLKRQLAIAEPVVTSREVVRKLESETSPSRNSKTCAEKAPVICLSPFVKSEEVVIPASTCGYKDRDHRNKRNVAKECINFLKKTHNANLFDCLMEQKDGSLLKQLVENWCQDPINGNPFFITVFTGSS